MPSSTKQKSTLKPKSRGGRPRDEAIRWTLNMAAREFGVHREQLERRRRALGMEANDDECFASRDIARMLFGDKEAELIGKLAAERRKLEIEVDVLLKTRIPRETFYPALEQCFGSITDIIDRSKLTDAERGEILAQMRDFPSVLKW